MDESVALTDPSPPTCDMSDSLAPAVSVDECMYAMLYTAARAKLEPGCNIEDAIATAPSATPPHEVQTMKAMATSYAKVLAVSNTLYTAAVSHAPHLRRYDKKKYTIRVDGDRNVQIVGQTAIQTKTITDAQQCADYIAAHTVKRFVSGIDVPTNDDACTTQAGELYDALTHLQQLANPP